ncbi:peptidylprolyl isomerase [Cyanobium sp. LEGE 06143]|uniref:peptidylprolyl isomerase n=1 Tax=Cyanobium sp. LEGE 06143 TaxID=945727 RepID=UPI00187F41F5|nr:peptidylprolyl isomerase [Cyanobium sp. LEGE 06143]MBE9172053.1 peptidylprolyl isomerase [Cyanobium sp. LEGE 06143]
MSSPDLPTLARYGLLRPFLRQQLLEELLAPIQLNEEEQEAALAQFRQDNGIDDDSQLLELKQALLLTHSDLDYQAHFPVKVWKYSVEHFSSKAESRFLANKADLDQVVYSLLRTANPNLARELFLQISEGESSFDQLAASHAEGPERATRGIVGPVPLAQAHPELMQRLRTARPGVVLEPFPIGEWWLLVRLESLEPASFDDEVADAMIQELLDEWLEEEVDVRLARLCETPRQAAVVGR